MSDFIARPVAEAAVVGKAVAMSRGALRVVIAADDESARLDLRRRLSAEGMLVCADAHDLESTLTAVVRERPDLCVLVDRPPLDATAAAAVVGDRTPAVRVVLLGPDPGDEALLAAVAAGASGYVSCGAPRLVEALFDVVAGRPAFPRRLGSLLIASLRYGESAG